MNYFNIVVDADDVLENFLKVWVNCLNERHGLHYTVEHMREWHMPSNIKELTEEQIYEPLYDDALWEMLEPIKDSVYYLDQLQADGHNVYICTKHTIFETLKTKLFRLQELFPFIDATQYIIAADKSIIKADIMIDDGVHNLASIDHPCIKLLFDRPHNRNVECEYTDMVRVESWESIYAIISMLSNNSVMTNFNDLMEEKFIKGR